jgi:hypothetical protein
MGSRKQSEPRNGGGYERGAERVGSTFVDVRLVATGL